MTVGLPNPRHVMCKFCKNILIPEGLAVKQVKNVSYSIYVWCEYEPKN